MSIISALNEGQDNFAYQPIMGVVTAIVTDIDDPDKLGRVKIKLIDRDCSEYETDFVRIMSPMTGDKWGMCYFPEVGDEVLAAFANGDITRPYILGSLWNEDKRPPVAIEDKKNITRIIKTKNGSQFLFHDEDDNDFIELSTPEKFTIKMEDKKKLITICDKENKNFIKIDSENGIVTIEGEKKINITAGNSKMILDGSSHTVTIESEQSLKLKSQQIVIEAKGTLDLKASGSLNVKSDGSTSIKGAIVKIN